MPPRRMLYQAMLVGLEAELTWVPANADWEGKDRRFASNGMSVCLERARLSDDAGLFEVATPECEGAEALCLRLRAVDDLLCRALPGARAHLAAHGYDGTFGLVKNSRDDEGAYYGRQENLQTTFVAGGWALLWWAGLVVLLPLVLVGYLWMLVTMVVRMVALVPTLAELDPSTPEAFTSSPAVNELAEAVANRFLWVISPLLGWAGFVGFRAVRGPLEGFLISRQCVSGTGWLDARGTLVLSEKGAAITRWFALDARPCADEHAVFATTNLLKMVVRREDLPRLFHRVQRLQLGLADSNRCEVAEVIAVTATARVVELAERGLLHDAPRFRDPVDALKRLGDIELRASVEDRTGRAWTALELQGFYQQRAAQAFPDDPIVRLWGEALQGLAAEPEAWVGRIDWVTKRWLLEQCGDPGSPAVQKRIDIGYHELGPEGLYDRVMAVVDPPPLLDPEAVAHAALHAPAGPASHRAALIEEHGAELATVEWSRVRLRDQVIFFGDRRNQ